MPRYFFHARTQYGLTVDDEGLMLTGLDEACLNALLAAEEVCKALSGLPPEDVTIEVTDESGRRLVTVPVSEVADRFTPTKH
jgi:hypothetical protein